MSFSITAQGFGFFGKEHEPSQQLLLYFWGFQRRGLYFQSSFWVVLGLFFSAGKGDYQPMVKDREKITVDFLSTSIYLFIYFLKKVYDF